MKKTFLTTFVFMFLLASVWVMAEKSANNPVTVSPGSETEVVTVWQSCPTFSWSAVDQAASYRVAVFESVDGNVPNVAAYETMATMASPVVSKDIPGPALSWTLSADEKLKTGGQYSWFVQALDINGNPLGSWSRGRIFKVEQELRFAGVAEKLGEVLKSYGVKDETITNVLTDMKSEVQEVGISGVKGLEGVDNTFYGQNAGASITTGYCDTFIGLYAGYADTTGSANTFLGKHVGYSNTTGSYNTFLGNYAGESNTTAECNTFVGGYAGRENTTGYNNNFLGFNAGLNNTTGHNNLFLGHYTGYVNTTGYGNIYAGNMAGYYGSSASNNIFIGYCAGHENTTGSGSIFLGYNAGYNETGSNKLYIDNSDTSTPLIYGEFDNDIAIINGKLGINRLPTYPLHMGSGAHCTIGGVWTNASSRSLKENIQSLSTDEAVDALNQLNPVKYNYKVDKADKHVGFIAEDVPELVASVDRKGLSPMDVTAVLTKVVQELKRENQDQQNLIQEQQKINQEYKKVISDLQERIAKLEKK